MKTATTSYWNTVANAWGAGNTIYYRYYTGATHVYRPPPRRFHQRR